MRGREEEEKEHAGDGGGQGAERGRGQGAGRLCVGGSDKHRVRKRPPQPVRLISARPHQRPARKNVGDQNVFIKLLY